MDQQPSTTSSGKDVKTSVKKEPSRGSEAFWGVPLTSLRSEIDHLFEDFASGWPFHGRGPAAQGFGRLPAAFRSPAPATDIVENDKAFVVSVDLPGIDEKNIQVDLSEDILSVRAEVTEERKEEKENYFLSERQHGALQRAFQVPVGVDADKIEAAYEKGVLKITLPKTAEALQKQRKIEVKTT